MSDEQENRKHYANLMYELKLRLAVLRATTTPPPPGGPTLEERIHFENACLQLRKVLELLAFSSLAANQKFCADNHLKFDEFWHAKKFTKKLATLNPNFFPEPLILLQTSPGHHHFDIDSSGSSLTLAEFDKLYDAVSGVLHVENPYAKIQQIDLKRSFADWISRIQRLLKVHRVRLTGGNMVLVEMLDWDRGGVNVAAASVVPPDTPGALG